MDSVQDRLDPLQFAYRPSRGVEDATGTLLNLVFKHLEGAKSLVRLLFVDFSSAFNCIQPHVLAGKLRNCFNIDPGLVSWLMDFLTNRSQRVRVNGTLSDVCLSSTGSPQGCVLSPLLFVLYTNDCQSTYPGRHIVKFADDSVIVSLLSQEDPVHGPVLLNFVEWCDSAFLNINVDKTKEMLIHFGRSPVFLSSANINDQPVEQVEQYKYLGTVIDNKLSFEPQVDAVCKKAHQRMHFYRKLRNFNVDHSFMKMFYSCFIESILTFSFICWHGSLSITQQNRVNDVVKVCSKIAGTALNDLSEVYKVRCVKKAKAVIADPSHPLWQEFSLLPSGRRYCVPQSRTNRFRKSMIPRAIGLLNAVKS